MVKKKRERVPMRNLNKNRRKNNILAKNKMNLRFLVLFALILVIASTALVFNNLNLKHSLVGFVASEDNAIYDYAIDTDGGDKPYTKGICIDGGVKSWTDKCQFGRKLVEYYPDPYYPTVCTFKTYECSCDTKEDVCLSQ